MTCLIQNFPVDFPAVFNTELNCLVILLYGGISLKSLKRISKDLIMHSCCETY